MTRCVVCNRFIEEKPDVAKTECPQCAKLAWGERVKLLQLRRIADSLEDMEKKMKDKNGW